MTAKQHIFRSHWPDAVIPDVLLSDFLAERLVDADHGNGNKPAFVSSADPTKSYTYKQFKELSMAVRHSPIAFPICTATFRANRCISLSSCNSQTFLAFKTLTNWYCTIWYPMRLDCQRITSSGLEAKWCRSDLLTQHDWVPCTITDSFHTTSPLFFTSSAQDLTEDLICEPI